MLWQLKNVRRKIQPIFMNIPPTGPKELANLGPVISIAKMIPMTARECFVQIPKSAF